MHLSVATDFIRSNCFLDIVVAISFQHTWAESSGWAIVIIATVRRPSHHLDDRRSNSWAIWSARKSYLKSLDTIHHQGLRLALGAFRTSPIESLYAESNEPSIYIRREKLSLQYVTKLAANPRNSAYDCVFNPKYERFYNNKPTAIKPLGLRIQPLLEEANINIKNVQPFSLPSKEPWTLNPPKIILDLHKNKKNRSRVTYF